MRELLTDAAEVEYRGAVTLGGSGRARFHDRAGGLGGMLWQALGAAGWINEIVSLRTTVSLKIGIGCAPPEARQGASAFAPLPGSVRRLGERGRVDEHGFVWQQYVGPLNGRAAGPGYRLVEREQRPEDVEFGEDLLYTAAVQAGWLSAESDEVVDVPDVTVSISVARRNPEWEAYANPDAVAASRASSASRQPASAVRSWGSAEVLPGIPESELRARALAVAARAGDPDPVLIQRAWGSRFEVTRTTGSAVFSDAPSCIVVMQGNFRARKRTPPHDDEPAGKFVSYPFQVLVFSLETGKITDSGSAHECPDLAQLGEVVTDRDARERKAGRADR